MKKLFWLVALLGLLVVPIDAAPHHKDRVEIITKELMKDDVFGLMQGGGVSRATMLDYQGIPTANAGCPPVGIARSFYDPQTDTFKVIDSNCNVIISGGGGGSSVAWNQLLNPNGNSSPDFGGTTFTFANGTWDWGTMNVVLPKSTGFAPSVLGQVGFDTVSGNFLFNNGAAGIVPLLPQNTAVNAGDLASFALSGNQITLAPVPANPSSGLSILQVTNTNVKLGDTYCVTGLGPPLVVDNCTPGVPTNVQVTDYTIDPINDRGTAIISNDTSNDTVSFSQQIADSTDMDASWFAFFANKGSGSTDLNLTSPSVFDSTGAQDDVLLTGQQCSMFTDQTSPGTAYPKCHEPRMIPGNGITLQRSPYFLTVSASPASASSNGIISGCGVSWTSGLTFEVSACTYSIGGSTFNTAETSITLAASDPTNPRIDDIIVTSSSTVDKITGTAAANPAQPTADPTSQLILTFATILANATTPVVSTTKIYLNNAGSPTEFNCTSTANLNCNSTNNPFSGATHSIEATTAVTTNSATLTKGSGSVNLASSDTFVFFIRNKASWAAAKSLQIFWRNGTTNVGTAITFKNGVYGFDQTNTTTYQQIAIPVTAFQTGVAPVTNVRFQVLGGGASIGFYLGNIFLQKGFTGGGGNGGGGSFQLQVNASPCQSPCSLTDTASVTFTHSIVAGVDQVLATAIGAPPSGTAGGDLSGTYPNPTVAKVNGASIPVSANYLRTNGSGQFVAGDFPDVKIIPAANCPNATAGSGWSYAASTYTAACRAGSNNLGGALQLAPTSGAAAQFLIELPQDWDTASQPFINIYYGSGANTSGTVIWTVSTACQDVSTPGGATDDPAFHAESAFSTQTMAVANRSWFVGGQLTAATSGNGCKALSPIIFKVTLSGTASSAINVYQAVVTIPRSPVVQAN